LEHIPSQSTFGPPLLYTLALLSVAIAAIFLEFIVLNCIRIMGAGASNPVGQMVAKNKANEVANQAKEGLNTLTGSKSEAEKERDQRAKDRNAEYEQKKKEREERKKKLSSQWAENKKANS